MDYILQNIGTNKINIPIISNSYEEINNYIEEENLFNNIENIIEIYQSGVGKVKKNYSNKNNFNIMKSDLNIVVNNDLSSNLSKAYNIDNKIINFNSLVLCVLEIIDPSVTLLNTLSKLEKIKNFKNMMLLNLDMLKLKISKDDMRKAIVNEDIIVCIYFAFLLKKNIVLITTDDIEIYGNNDECIAIEYNIDEKIYKISHIIGSLDFFKQLMIEKRIKIMIENDIIEKLNSFLLKDLKDIADKLKIQTFKIEDNKKKNLLKNELKDLIKLKLE
jgi:hypothetical protein